MKIIKAIIFCTVFFILSQQDLPLAFAEISVIVNMAQKDQLNEKEIYNLYLGIEKNSQLELLHQEEGRSTRSEFLEKFLHNSEVQMKQKWSTLIFSGNRIPAILADDHSILDYIKRHPNAIGYVDSRVATQIGSDSEFKDQVVVLFKVP